MAGNSKDVANRGRKEVPPTPLHTIVGATHDKVCDFGTLHLKLGINIQIYLF